MYCVASLSVPAGGMGAEPYGCCWDGGIWPGAFTRPRYWVASAGTSGGRAPGATGAMYCVAAASEGAVGAMYCVASEAEAGGMGAEPYGAASIGSGAAGAPAGGSGAE